MPTTAHRALALVTIAVLGAAVAAAAQAKPHGPSRGKPARARSVATKLGAGRGWVPPALLGSRPPLTGPAATGAGGGHAPSVATSPGAPVPVAPSGGPAPTTPADPAVPLAVTSVGVLFDDTPSYVAQLSRATVAAGTVTVQLQNRGEDPHNLRVVPTDHPGPAVDFPLTDPGATATQALALAPGRYHLFCTLTVPVDHAAAGMSATLTVTAAP